MRRVSTLGELTATERARLQSGHDWVRLLAFALGTLIAVGFSMKPGGVWLIASAGFVAMIFPSLRLSGVLPRHPMSAMVIDLFYAAIVAGAAATQWLVPVIAVLGTLVIGYVVLPSRQGRLVPFAVGAAAMGIVIADFFAVADLEESPAALVAGSAVTLVVLAAVMVTLTVARQWGGRIQTERDAALAGINVAMDVAAVSVMVVDSTGRIVSRFGWSGLPVTEDTDHVVALAGVPELSVMVADAFEGTEVSASVFVADRVLNAAAAPITQDGAPWAVSLAVSDITEPVMAGRRADQASRWKTDFIATVSHEIRTPLTAVLGFLAEVDQQVCSRDPLAHEYLQIVTEQAQEAADIVEDLLVATRQEAGELSILAEPVDLVEEAARVVSGLGDRAGSVSIEGAAGLARADRTRVRQIVRNLVTNALKYGGTAVRIVLSQELDRIEFSVLDNGPGISISSRDLVFRPFFQVGERSAPGGFGLGLSVSRALANAMGGSLVYDFVEGWSRFVLVLPAYDQATHEAPTESIS